MSVQQGSKSRSSNAPSAPADYAGYFGGLNDLTGGRLSKFAKEGTPKLTAEQIQAYGGLGVTRTADVNRQSAQAIGDINADQALTGTQRDRSIQLSDQDTQARLAAINKETEASLTGLNQYNDQLSNADLELLIEAYYGGKGNVGYSKGQGGGGGDSQYANWQRYSEGK